MDRPTVEKLGDVKKDKLKTSFGMTNEEKDKLLAKEQATKKNRGVCMVSQHSWRRSRFNLADSFFIS